MLSLIGTLDFTEDTDGTGTSDTLGNAYNRFDSIEVIDIIWQWRADSDFIGTVCVSYDGVAQRL